MINQQPKTLTQATGTEWLHAHVDEALREDLGERGDVTSLATIPHNQHGVAELVAKEQGVIAGIDWAICTGERTSPRAEWSFTVSDGDIVEPGQVLATVTGPMLGILISERTALNGLAHLSGVASMAYLATQAVRGTKAVIIDTRKTFPGWRLAQKYAVLCGGGGNHRIGLYDEVLIKENHVEGAGGISASLQATQLWLQEKDLHLPVEIEVTSLKELEDAIASSPDRVLLDNFTPDMLREAVRLAGDRCVLEASGGITLENVGAVAQAGVHRISLGALTHSVKQLDLSLLVRNTFTK